MPQSNVYSNLDGLGDLLGGFSGVADAVEEDAYMGSVIRSAHRKVTNIFDVAAAATARSGKFTHMYEFGVPGITSGRPSHMDPTAPDSRLYVHTIVGRGKSQEIGFNFRPAKTRNPDLTTASTGVASKYLRKLSRRKYVFWNKAMVMETGEQVTISPKNGRFLFVPFGQFNSYSARNNKGFVLWDADRLGPITAQPGRNVQGNFSTFWFSWWNSQGGSEMATAMGEDIDNDVRFAIQRVQAHAASEGRRLTPIEATNVRYAYVRSQKLTKRIFEEFTRGGGFVVE